MFHVKQPRWRNGLRAGARDALSTYILYTRSSLGQNALESEDMAHANPSEVRFTDDDAARSHLEAIRWPNGPVCPHCGGVARNSLLQGQSHRAGLYFCGDCRSQFSVTVGTVLERSKVPLHKWVLATHLMCSSKQGISSHQLHRTLGVTYKTAWFMTHRIREAM